MLRILDLRWQREETKKQDGMHKYRIHSYFRIANAGLAFKYLP